MKPTVFSKQAAHRVYFHRSSGRDQSVQLRLRHGLRRSAEDFSGDLSDGTSLDMTPLAKNPKAATGDRFETIVRIQRRADVPRRPHRAMPAFKSTKFQRQFSDVHFRPFFAQDTLELVHDAWDPFQAEPDTPPGLNALNTRNRVNQRRYFRKTWASPAIRIA